MKTRKYILEILRDHQPLTFRRFDHFFYQDNSQLTHWLAAVKEMTHEQLIKEHPLRITSKGLQALQQMN